MSTKGRSLQIGLLVAGGILAFGALGIYAARDNIVRYTLNPDRPFGQGVQASEPNYETDAAWAFKNEQPGLDADVFFIYPTIFFSGEFWNAPISNAAVKERLERTIRPLYAEPFAAAANLYMPYYRQAAPYSFMSGTENGRSARALAYKDVARAFAQYTKEAKPDRPLIIAGYGQGALYGLRLISELKPSERSRLVAAFLLEVAIPTEVLSTMTTGVPLCDSPDQTGCSVIWHSTTQNARGDLPRENALVWKKDGGFEPTRGRELACVNPLTWTISGRAGSPDMNLGAATISDFGSNNLTITPAATSADCWNGLLFTDLTPEPMFLWSGPRYRELFPSNINPFYEDIKDNVARRIETYIAQRAAIPETTPETETSIDPSTEAATEPLPSTAAPEPSSPQ
jgi:hypothetical protein